MIMASTPPTSQRVPVPPSKEGKAADEVAPRKIRVAHDEAVKAELERFAREHRELIEDLAK
jgi:hypothetical protein